MGKGYIFGSQFPLMSGGFFDFSNIEQSIYTIEDVAQGLSRHYRFAGHTPSCVTVAQHSVILSFMVPQKHALLALLHDGSEAFLGDIVRGAKQYLNDYTDLEDRVMKDLLDRVGLNWQDYTEIVEFDRLLGDKEALLCRSDSNDFPDEWAKVGGTEFWFAQHAKEEFLDRWNQLTKRSKTSILLR